MKIKKNKNKIDEINQNKNLKNAKNV